METHSFIADCCFQAEYLHCFLGIPQTCNFMLHFFKNFAYKHRHLETLDGHKINSGKKQKWILCIYSHSTLSSHNDMC